MVAPLRQVPEPVATAPACHGRFPAGGEELEHHDDVAVVVPAARGPRHDAGVGDLGRDERTVLVEAREHVVAELGVVLEPAERRLVTWRAGHLRPVEREVLHGAHHERELEEGVAALERLEQLARGIRVAESAPQHQVGCGRHRRRGLDLHEREVPHHLEEVGGPLRAEQPRAHGDPPCLVDAQPVGVHPLNLPSVRAAGPGWNSSGIVQDRSARTAANAASTPPDTSRNRRRRRSAQPPVGALRSPPASSTLP